MEDRGAVGGPGGAIGGLRDSIGGLGCSGRTGALWRTPVMSGRAAPCLATRRYTTSYVFFSAATASSCITSSRLTLFTSGVNDLCDPVTL